MVYAGTEHPDEAAEFAINLFGAEDNTRGGNGVRVYNHVCRRASQCWP